jgi:hypothetical protein
MAKVKREVKRDEPREGVTKGEVRELGSRKVMVFGTKEEKDRASEEQRRLVMDMEEQYRQERARHPKETEEDVEVRDAKAVLARINAALVEEDGDAAVDESRRTPDVDESLKFGARETEESRRLGKRAKEE